MGGCYIPAGHIPLAIRSLKRLSNDEYLKYAQDALHDELVERHLLCEPLSFKKRSRVLRTIVGLTIFVFLVVIYVAQK